MHVRGTYGDSLEVWAEGAARVGELPEEVDSTRAELVGEAQSGYGWIVAMW